MPTPEDITLRPEAASDEPFLRRVIHETIAEELGAGAWPEPMRSHLLDMQYTARRHVRHDSGQDSSVIQADGADAGWVFVNMLPDAVYLVEIMVLQKLRGRGIGTAAIRRILAEAREMGKPVRLNVNVLNIGAIRLYERLGFRRIDGDEVQQVMKAE